MLLVGTPSGCIDFYDLETLKKVKSHKAHKFGTNAIAVDVYNSYIFSAGDDGLVKAMTIDATEEHTFSGHRGHVQSLAVDPMNMLLLSGSQDKSAILWDLRIGTECSVFHNIHKEGVNTVSFSHDSTLFLTASFDGTVNIWDTLS
jgi:WD40 repeat protein